MKNQFWEAAFFQDLGNSPATFGASRWADFYGCLPRNDVKLADADFRKFRRPVVRLIKASYGHPDSGTMWEQHCDRNVKELKFVPVGEEWPSMHFHKELQLLLVIYVDDLKMAGPKQIQTEP